MTQRVRPFGKNSTLPGAAGAVILSAALLVSAHIEAAPDLFSGRWAMLQLLATTSEIPTIGTLRSNTETVVLFDLTYREGILSGEGSLCRLRINSGTSLVQTVIPERFRATLPTPRIEASLKFSGGRWLFHQPKQYVVVGAKLNDVIKDPLPVQASDPRVFDQDKDGKPGVTIRISGIATGDIYVIQRNWTELYGSLKAPGRFEGKVLFGNEQHVLGASAGYLARGPHAKPASENSLFYLVRTSKKASCSQALKAFALP